MSSSLATRRRILMNSSTKCLDKATGARPSNFSMRRQFWQRRYSASPPIGPEQWALSRENRSAID
jgi:hypothetical protein